jgi:hypothetical protein
MIAYASRLKDQANALYRKQKIDFAIKKYDRAVSNLKRFHGEYTDKQGMVMTALQVALLSNLAAAYMAKGVCILHNALPLVWCVCSCDRTCFCLPFKFFSAHVLSFLFAELSTG